jgi:Protein of unknown function (DUF3662)
VSVLNKVRRWIDGETAELVLEEAARDAQVKPRSKSEEFIVKIARAVEEVMQNEMVPLPQGTTIIPTEYTIFLSNEDDKEWQGVKRRGLEQGLYHILAERAKEISGKKKLETKSFVIELRVDGTLERGDVRVQHSWEDSNANKTSILARPKNLPEIAPDTKSGPPPYVAPTVQYTSPAPARPTAPNFTQSQPVVPGNAPATTPRVDIPQAVPIPAEEGEEMTHVHKRSMTELYKLEIWRGGVRQNVVPIYQNEITVGRGSKTKPVDISLSGDVEISRRHILMATDGAGNFWIVNEGRNPAMINNYELPIGQRVSVSPGVSISVCSFLLRIQPK